MPRYFRLEQAEQLLPELEGAVRAAVTVKRSFDEAQQELAAVSERIALAGGVSVDREAVRRKRSRRDALASRLKQSIESIQRHGCQVKDLDMGLVDFPTLYHGEEVCLCWKLGEPAVAFWHNATEGFRGRKPVDREFRDTHRGE
jgi:hypothetical protein